MFKQTPSLLYSQSGSVLFPHNLRFSCKAIIENQSMEKYQSLLKTISKYIVQFLV